MNSCLENEINAFLWVSLIAVTCFLLSKLVELFRLWAKARPVPGPPSPSFYGHSPLISRSNLSDLLSVSHKKYGPVVKLWLGPSQLLVSIMDPELIQEMLVKAADKLPLSGRAFRLAFGRSSFFISSFEKVEKHRNSLHKALSGKPVQRGNLLVKQVLDSVMERNQNNMANVGALDCETISQQLAFTMQGATLFGDVFLTWSKATIYEELVVNIAKDSCSRASYSVAPIWKQAFWDYRGTCTKLKSLTKELLQRCRHNFNEDSLTSQKFGQSNSSSNLMQSNFFSWEPGGYLESDGEAFGNLISIMFHGSLTIAGLISSVLTRLVIHPEVQDKIYSEITTARKFSQSQGQQDIDQMPLLLATIYESARLLPAGPLLQRCSLQRDLHLKNGVMIPAGAILVVPIQLVQIDCTTWGKDARLFNPYRFLSSTENRSDIHSSSDAGLFNVTITPSNHLEAAERHFEKEQVKDAGQTSYVLKLPNKNAAFLPFGSGARACVGQRLAVLEVSALFASLLKNYEVKLQPGSEIHPKPMMQNSVLKLLPSPKIIFVRRSS